MRARCCFIQRTILFLLLLSSGYLSVFGMGSVAAQSGWRPGDGVRRVTGSYADPQQNVSKFSLKNNRQRLSAYASSGASARRGVAYGTRGRYVTRGNGANYSRSGYRSGTQAAPPSQRSSETYLGAEASSDQSYATIPYRPGARGARKASAGGVARRRRAGMRPGSVSSRAMTNGGGAGVRPGYRAGTGNRVDAWGRAPRGITQAGVSPYYTLDRWCPDPCCIQWCFFRREYFVKPTYCQPYRCCQPKPECCPAERPPCPPPPCVDECGRPQEDVDEAAALWEAGGTEADDIFEEIDQSEAQLEAEWQRVADVYLGEDGLEVASEYI